MTVVVANATTRATALEATMFEVLGFKVKGKEYTEMSLKIGTGVVCPLGIMTGTSRSNVVSRLKKSSTAGEHRSG
jgi:hypothetical protein